MKIWKTSLLIAIPVILVLTLISIFAQEDNWSLTPWDWCVYNPVLGPQGNTWQAQKVFDPAVIVKDNKLYLFYRGETFKEENEKRGISSIGLAVSEDGMDFKRMENPVLAATESFEQPWGCYSPRIVEFDGTYYMTYSGFDGEKFRLALAVSKDLINWEKKGLIFPGKDFTKNGAILQGKINGQYVMYFGEGKIWIAYSDDLLHWKAEEKPVLEPRPGSKKNYDFRSIEPGPPPVLTSKGILLICNGLDKYKLSSIGETLFSSEDPSKVLRRMDETCLVEPPADCVGNFKIDIKMFAEGLVFFKNVWHLYYSYEDLYISLSTCEKRKNF